MDDDVLAPCHVMPSVPLRLEQDCYWQCTGYRFYFEV